MHCIKISEAQWVRIFSKRFKANLGENEDNFIDTPTNKNTINKILLENHVKIVTITNRVSLF